MLIPPPESSPPLSESEVSLELDGLDSEDFATTEHSMSTPPNTAGAFLNIPSTPVSDEVYSESSIGDGAKSGQVFDFDWIVPIQSGNKNWLRLRKLSEGDSRLRVKQYPEPTRSRSPDDPVASPSLRRTSNGTSTCSDRAFNWIFTRYRNGRTLLCFTKLPEGDPRLGVEKIPDQMQPHYPVDGVAKYSAKRTDDEPYTCNRKEFNWISTSRRNGKILLRLMKLPKDDARLTGAGRPEDTTMEGLKVE